MPTTGDPFMWALGTGVLIGAAWPWLMAGGTVLAIPALLAVIGLKHPRVALGTSLMAMSSVAFIGTTFYAWRRSIDWLGTLDFTVPALAGLELERGLGFGLPLRVRLIILGCLLLLTSAFMLSLPESEDACLPGYSRSRSLLVPWGLIVGILGGWFGLGGGLLVMPTLLLSGLPLVAAAGSSFVSITSLGIANALPYATQDYVHWTILGLFLLGVAMGMGLSVVLIRKIGYPRSLSRMATYGLVLISLLIIGVDVHGLYT